MNVSVIENRPPVGARSNMVNNFDTIVPRNMNTNHNLEIYDMGYGSNRLTASQPSSRSSYSSNNSYRPHHSHSHDHDHNSRFLELSDSHDSDFEEFVKYFIMVNEKIKLKNLMLMI